MAVVERRPLRAAARRADEAVGEEKDQNIIQFMKQEGDNSYRVSKDLLLFEGNEEDGMEMDIEGIAVSGDLVYVLGSNSAKRTRIEESEKYETNREALRDDEISPEKSRRWLYPYHYPYLSGVRVA